MTLRRDFATPLPPSEYGAEVLSSGWNPIAVQAPELAAQVRDRSVESPHLSDTEAFLPLFYRMQQA